VQETVITVKRVKHNRLTAEIFLIAFIVVLFDYGANIKHKNRQNTQKLSQQGILGIRLDIFEGENDKWKV
jgi:hypothetical protein